MAPGDRKAGSLKRRVRSHLGRGDLKNCCSCDAKQIYQIWKSKRTKQTCSEHFWKLRCGKTARRCGAKHISKSKCEKHTAFGPLLHVQASLCVEGAMDFCTLSKASQTCGFCTMFKNDGRHGTFEEDVRRMWQAQHKRHLHQRC